MVLKKECDKSCSSCTGDGPDECIECATNFELRDGLCKGKFLPFVCFKGFVLFPC